MNELVRIITAPELQGKLLPLKILSIPLSLFFLGSLFYFRSKTSWARFGAIKEAIEFFSFKPYEAVELPSQWRKIEKRMEKGWESEAKLAVIEADNLLESVLIRMGYAGQSLGERLKQLDDEVLSNIDDVWKAHKVRNDIVHDPGYKLSLGRVRGVIDIYQKALEHLNAF